MEESASSAAACKLAECEPEYAETAVDSDVECLDTTDMGVLVDNLMTDELVYVDDTLEGDVFVLASHGIPRS